MVGGAKEGPGLWALACWSLLRRTEWTWEAYRDGEKEPGHLGAWGRGGPGWIASHPGHLPPPGSSLENGDRPRGSASARVPMV